jgi:predicted Zn-dependent protease
VTGAAPRVAVAALAVVLVAWLGVMERDHRLFTRGNGAATFRAADSDLRAARLLNPDSGPDLIRAIRLQRAGRWQQALATVEPVLRREPDNLYAWNTLGTVARGHDPAAFLRAQAAARRLDPLNAPGR